MAFDITSLTKVVNQYLNSISDVNQSVQEVNKAAENRRLFTDTLGEAIKAETQKRMADFPDIPSMIQSSMESHMRSDDTFAKQQTAVSETASATASANSSTAAKELVNAVTSNQTGTNTNADAFKGQLSTEALQELAKSGYFSGNLIQSDLFNESKEEDTSSSLDSGNNLSDLNAKYLLASYLNKNTDTATSIFGDFTL